MQFCNVGLFVYSIGNINPFRWKGHYYDVESGLYYANGSYYDPEVGLHVDAMPASAAIENAFKVFGLDLCGLMCDNILAYLPYVYSIFATLDLSPILPMIWTLTNHGGSLRGMQ